MTNKINNNIGERITHLANNLHTFEYADSLSYPDVKNAPRNILHGFVVLSIDKTTGNIPLVCKNFMPILNYLQILRTRSSTNLQMILLTKI